MKKTLVCFLRERMEQRIDADKKRRCFFAEAAVFFAYSRRMSSSVSPRIRLISSDARMLDWLSG